ncbi:MAG: type IV pilus biogenesis/stability protein PilW [Nitrosomonas sp.]|nr:type IV pilus biogenesis/stability protein PilW [Nitrosomonas sp.]MDP1949834.1 type IV pilus biogenesis/stability protein PilW [Nitrosomonas sp.]
MKKMLFGFIMVSVVLISGCVQQSVQGDLSAEQHQQRAEQSAKIHTRLAAEYYYRGQYKVSIEEVKEALRANSSYAPAYNVFGLIYMSLHENDLAQKNFEQALKFSPKDPEIHNNYGWFLCQRMPERMDRAIEHFMTALKDRLYSAPERSYTNAGVCELKRNSYSAASEYFKRALLIDSTYSAAVIGLIEVDFRSGNVMEAKAKLSRYMQNSTPTPQSLWLAIQIEREIGDHYAEDSFAYQLRKRFPESIEASALREGRLK